MIDMDVQKANEKSFFGKNICGFEPGICGSKDKCPRPLS